MGRRAGRKTGQSPSCGARDEEAHVGRTARVNGENGVSFSGKWGTRVVQSDPVCVSAQLNVNVGAHRTAGAVADGKRDEVRVGGGSAQVNKRDALWSCSWR